MVGVELGERVTTRVPVAFLVRGGVVGDEVWFEDGGRE